MIISKHILVAEFEPFLTQSPTATSAMVLPSLSSDDHVSNSNGIPNANGDSDHTIEVNSSLGADMEVAAILLRATNKAIEAINRSHDEVGQLQAENARLKCELSTLKAEKDVALKNANAARNEMAKVKTKHAEHTKKLQTQASDYKKKYDTLQASYKGEMQGHTIAVEEAREVRKEHQKLLVENKGLRKKVASKLEEHTEELDGLKDAKKMLESRVLMLEIQVKSLEEDIEEVGKILTLKIQRNAELAGRNHELAEKNVKLEAYSADLKACNEFKADLETDKTWRELSPAQKTDHEPDGLMCSNEVEAIYKAEAARYAQLQEQNIELMKQLTKLEEELELKAPLVEKAIDIRMRFAVQARKVLFGETKDGNDIALIRAGNDAAHRADGIADEAMFLLGLHKNWSLWTQTFEKLYGTKPGNYNCLAPDLRKVYDCKASLLVLRKSQPLSGHGVEGWRRNAGKLIRIISEEYRTDNYKAGESVYVKGLVKDLQGWTTRLVNEDWKSYDNE